MDHLTEPELRAYRDRTLAPDALVRTSGHIAECEDCRRKLRESRTDAHLTAMAVQQFIDGSLPENDWLETEQHLEWCAECRTDVEQLRQFAARWKKPAPRPSTRWWLAAAAALVVASGIGIWTSRPRMVVSLNDRAGLVTLDSRGNLNGVSGLTPGQNASIRRVLQSGKLETPSILAELQPQPSPLMGSAPARHFHLEAPVGTAVASPRPTFRWTAWAPDADYVVTLKNLNSGQVVSSPSLRALAWEPAQPLQPGAAYEWQVAATLHGREEVVPGPPAAPARFQVLDADRAELLAHLPPSHLARAILFAEAGLLDEAAGEAKTLAQLNPASPTARNLTHTIESLR